MAKCIKKAGVWLRGTLVLLGLCGIVWFFLPIKYLAMTNGSVFGIGVCLILILFALLYHRMVTMGGWKRKAVRAAAGLYILFLVWLGYLTVLMNSAQYRKPPPNTNLILLGAQVKPDGTLSRSLQDRVDAAYQYLIANPDAICITTGGQGTDEPLEEGNAQKKALIRLGIDETRILVEAKSRNTRQNMEFAYEIAMAHGLSEEICVVTHDFHMFRSLKLAENAGFTAYCTPAKTDPYLYSGYYGRELMSLTKWHIEKWILGKG